MATALERRRLGRTDMDVSILGFGGSEIGYERVSVATVARLLGAAIDAGLNVIDTAECYESSEELIGQAVGARRSDYYLFTKSGHPHGYGREDWRPDSILKTLERSLQRLRTDHVDLVQLHSCDESDLRKGDVIAALERARARGLARYIGYSGDGSAARYAIECGRFDTLQTSLNVADQEALDLTVPLARERGIGVIAKRPIANAAWRTGRKPTNPYYHIYWQRLARLDYDFLRLPVSDSVGQALRFTVSQPGVHTAIVGTTKPARWAENAGHVSAGLLSADESERIRGRWRQVADAGWVGQR